ncbi:acetyltransferase [Halenospora varia]|nr:acetyltransferase [Halenospora varia]
MVLDSPVIFNPEKHMHLLPSLVSIHAACILSPPYTIALFLPPLDNGEMTSWWQDRISEVANHERHILMQLATNTETGKEEVAGVVMLNMPKFWPTGPWKADVEKLLVGPEYRKMGIARKLMEMVEEVARLGTEVGSPAEMIYPKLGYVEIGVLPGCEIWHIDGSWKDEKLFYKDLRKETAEKRSKA